MAAGLGFKTFTTGEVLTSADVNGYLMQGVLVFASAAARNAAITSPQEGQFAFTKDTNGLWYYDGAAWVASGATGDIEGVTAGVGISGGGTSGTVTVTNSMATAIDAKGDLVAGTGADAFSRLAVGANDTVLTADSAEATGLKWATASSGSMTSLASGSLPTGAATLTLSSISASYNNLILLVKGFRTATSGDYLRMRFNGVTSASYATQNDLAGGGIVTTSTSMRVQGAISNSANNGQLNIFMLNYASANTKFFYSMGLDDAVTPTEASMSFFAGGVLATTAISSVTIFSNSTNNFAAGTYILYGVK
jgi:hypothetical protein